MSLSLCLSFSLSLCLCLSVSLSSSSLPTLPTINVSLAVTVPLLRRNQSNWYSVGRVEQNNFVIYLYLAHATTTLDQLSPTKSTCSSPLLQRLYYTQIQKAWVCRYVVVNRSNCEPFGVCCSVGIRNPETTLPVYALLSSLTRVWRPFRPPLPPRRITKLVPWQVQRKKNIVFNGDRHHNTASVHCIIIIIAT